MPIKSTYMTLYMIGIVMFALPMTIYEIFANEINCPMFDIEYDGKVEKETKMSLDPFNCKCKNLYS